MKRKHIKKPESKKKKTRRLDVKIDAKLYDHVNRLRIDSWPEIIESLLDLYLEHLIEKGHDTI